MRSHIFFQRDQIRVQAGYWRSKYFVFVFCQSEFLHLQIFRTLVAQDLTVNTWQEGVK